MLCVTDWSVDTRCDCHTVENISLSQEEFYHLFLFGSALKNRRMLPSSRVVLEIVPDSMLSFIIVLCFYSCPGGHGLDPKVILI